MCVKYLMTKDEFSDCRTTTTMRTQAVLQHVAQELNIVSFRIHRDTFVSLPKYLLTSKFTREIPLVNLITQIHPHSDLSSLIWHCTSAHKQLRSLDCRRAFLYTVSFNPGVGILFYTLWWLKNWIVNELVTVTWNTSKSTQLWLHLWHEPIRSLTALPM